MIDLGSWNITKMNYLGLTIDIRKWSICGCGRLERFYCIYKYANICKYMCTFLWLGFCILAIFKVISEWVQLVTGHIHHHGTMTTSLTLGSPCPIEVMLSARLGSNKEELCTSLVRLAGFQTIDLLQGKAALY